MHHNIFSSVCGINILTNKDPHSYHNGFRRKVSSNINIYQLVRSMQDKRLVGTTTFDLFTLGHYSRFVKKPNCLKTKIASKLETLHYRFITSCEFIVHEI